MGEGSQPAWAKGYQLEYLQSIARVFAEHDGDLPLSPFTRFKERDVAEAAANGTLWISTDDKAYAVVENVVKARPMRDFSGAVVGAAEPGGVLVSRMACRPGGSQSLLDLLVEANRESPKGMWVHCWQEHPLDRAIVSQLDLWPGGTKIRASSELIGMWTNTPVQATPIAETLGLSQLRLAVEDDMLEAAAAELAEVSGYAQHYSSYNKGGSWSALALRGYGPPGAGADPDFIIKPAEMSRKWKRENEETLEWECQEGPLLEELPAVATLEKLLPGYKQRSRLMLLEPGGGELTRHADITDPEAGVGDGKVLRLHIPIITNPDVLFHMWQLDGSQEEANMRPGEVWYLDTRKPHTAKNGGESQRVHLVVDVFSNPQLLDLLGTHAMTVVPAPSGEWVR